MGRLDGDKGSDYGVADLGYAPQVGKKSEWITGPIKKPKKLRVTPKRRRKGKHPLTRISEQLPMKLPVLPKD